MAIGQSESKLVQDVNLVSNIPTPFHAEDEISLPNEAIDLSRTKKEVRVPNRNSLGKSISKLHTLDRERF